MSVDKLWGHFFKPEVRRSGEALVAKKQISITANSDIEVRAFVKGTTSFIYFNGSLIHFPET